jgi:hypothetical protein
VVTGSSPSNNAGGSVGGVGSLGGVGVVVVRERRMKRTEIDDLLRGGCGGDDRPSSSGLTLPPFGGDVVTIA